MASETTAASRRSHIVPHPILKDRLQGRQSDGGQTAALGEVTVDEFTALVRTRARGARSKPWSCSENTIWQCLPVVLVALGLEANMHAKPHESASALCVGAKRSDKRRAVVAAATGGHTSLRFYTWPVG
jgi:hypothetical protein